jgi:hypothetical protein
VSITPGSNGPTVDEHQPRHVCCVLEQSRPAAKHHWAGKLAILVDEPGSDQAVDDRYAACDTELLARASLRHFDLVHKPALYHHRVLPAAFCRVLETTDFVAAFK